MDAENENTQQSDSPPAGEGGAPRRCECGVLDDRLWSIGGPVDDSPDRIEPGNRHWRSIRLLEIAADHLPDHERRAAAEDLVDDLFSYPVIEQRRQVLTERGVEPEEIREDAVAFLIERVWEREHGDANYGALVARLYYHLGHRLSRHLAGPEEHRERKSDAPDPTAAFEKLDSGDDGESDGERWLSRHAGPGDAEECWSLILDLEHDLRSAEPDYAEELLSRLRGGTADSAGVRAVRLLLEYRRDEATERERAVIDAMLSEHQSAGRWNVSEAHAEHYDPPAPEHDVGRRQFAEDWSQIKENLAA